MTNPWRTPSGRKVFKAACKAAGLPVTVQEEVGDSLCEKLVREWLVEKHGGVITYERVGVTWSVLSKPGSFGTDCDPAKALIAAGLAALKGEKA